MEILDKIPGIINYAVVNAEDGSIEEVKGSSTSPLGDLTAFFSSAAEVIKNTLNLGDIDFVSLCYGANRLIVFLHNGKYIGIEIEREKKPREFLLQVKEQLVGVKREVMPEEKIIEEKVVVEERAVEEIKPAPKVEVQLPRSINSKLAQINLLVDEFGSGGNKAHWLEILNQGLGVIATDILPMVGVINNKMEFKQVPPAEKEDDIIQILRTLIDFLVKKAVEEMGSSQARVKVQAVIEKMKQI